MMRIVSESISNGSAPQWLRSFLSDAATQVLRKYPSLDLNNFTYIGDKVPTSNRDPRLSDKSRLNVFKVEGNPTPYIIGLTSPYIRSIQTHAGDLSWKALLPHVEEFGYIDLTDNSNSRLDKSRARKTAQQGADDHQSYKQYKRYPYSAQKYNFHSKKYEIIPGHENDYTWLTRSGQGDTYYDKSGYLVDPNKYKKLLDEINMSNYTQVLDRIYNRIIKLKNQTDEIFSQMDIKSGSLSSTGNDYLIRAIDELSSANKSISGAIINYRRLMDDIEKYSKKDSTEFSEWAQHSMRYYTTDIRKNLEYAKSYINKCNQYREQSLNA